MINHLNLIISTEHTLGFYWVLISLSVESVILLSTFCESWRNNHLFCHFTLLFLILQLSSVSITVYRCYRHTWMTIQHCKINNTCRFANVDTLLEIHTISLNRLSIISTVQTLVKGRSLPSLIILESPIPRYGIIWQLYHSLPTSTPYDVPLLRSKMCRSYNGRYLATRSIRLATTDTIGICVENRSKDHVWGWWECYLIVP